MSDFLVVEAPFMSEAIGGMQDGLSELVDLNELSEPSGRDGHRGLDGLGGLSGPGGRDVHRGLDGFVAFTTLAERSSGGVASFREDSEEDARRELEVSLAPLKLTWLSLEHAGVVAQIPTNSFEHEPHLRESFSDESRARGITADAGLVDALEVNRARRIKADAGLVGTPGHAFAFTTADCLPIVLVSKKHMLIAGIHAGWRGLAKDVIENCCQAFAARFGGTMPEDVQGWIGPAIAARDYEVDSSTRQTLLASPQVSVEHFSPTRLGHFLADLRAMAVAKLTAMGLPSESIAICPGSTFADTRYHSARRDGEASGRMATVVGIRYTDVRI